MLRRHTRKQHRRMSRKSKKTVHRRHKKHSMKHRKTVRRTRGGVAPISYSMARDSAALQSIAQGEEFAKFHAAQHGGMRGAYTTVATQELKQMGGVAPVASIGVPMLSQVGYDRAMTTTLNKAVAEATAMGHQQGGRRHRRRTQRKTKSKKHSRRHRRVRGGMAPVTAATMLLPKGLEAAAGLNPGYVSVAGTAEGVAASLDKQIRGQTWY